MIEMLTIVKTTDETGNINLTINGSLPIDEAAKALVIVAYNAQKPEQKSQKKSQKDRVVTSTPKIS